MMLREELKSLVGENMYQLKEQINDIPNHFPFNLANELSDQYKHCDIRKLYDVINELDPKHGAALILKYKYNFSYERIEETLGYNPGCGSMIMNRILNKLKQHYDIYVYDKEYVDSVISDVKIKKYEDEINNLKIEISKLNKDKEYLVNQVLEKGDLNTSIKNLTGKRNVVYRLMSTDIDILDLSTKAYNVISKKYKNLYELNYATIEELWKMQRLDSETIKEIVDKLEFEDIHIEHVTIENINTGEVKYVSKNYKIDYNSWIEL